MAIPVGQAAPDFTMTSQTGDKITLSQYRGKPVVFAWFPAAFTAG